jgi:hypothetical protein
LFDTTCPFLHNTQLVSADTVAYFFQSTFIKALQATKVFAIAGLDGRTIGSKFNQL